MKNDSLIIFARAPVPGDVKTRLCPPLTPDEAARLHSAFVEDTLEKALSLESCPVTLAYTPRGSGGLFGAMEAARGASLSPQTGADLGERMHNSLESALKAGAGKAVLIGTDIPALTAGLISEAFNRLDACDLVLGPSLDGGYYLIGLKRAQRGLFEGMAWSSPEVLDATLERAGSLGMRVSLLPALTDVDTPDDLAALAGAELSTVVRAALSGLGMPAAAQPGNGA